MKKVLLIDNDILFLEDLGRTLTLIGFEVRNAETGVDGIHFINKERFDVIITNLFIPLFNGNDVARHARLVRKKEVFIIGMSEKPWLFNDKEFDRIVSKLISTADLAQAIKECTAPLKKISPAKKPRPRAVTPFHEETIKIAALSN